MHDFHHSHHDFYENGHETDMKETSNGHKIITFLLLLLAVAPAAGQYKIIHPAEKISLDEKVQIRQDVRVYVYETHQLTRRDSTHIWGWITGWADYERLPPFQLVGRDTLVLELMVEHYFWYDRFRYRLLAHRYVPYDDYPADLSRGEVKAILRRMDKLERKP